MNAEKLIREMSNRTCRYGNHDWEGGALNAAVYLLEQIVDNGSCVLERIDCKDMDDREYFEVLLQYLDRAVHQKEMRYLVNHK
jgi:hypothetical protein